MSQNDLALVATEVGHLMARYTRAADTKDFDALAETFTEDVVMTIGGETVTGRDDVLAWYRAAIDPDGWSQHLLGNQLVESIEGDTATFSTYFQATSVSATGEPRVTLGIYRVTAHRDAGTFRIAHNAITVDRSFTLAVAAD